VYEAIDIQSESLFVPVVERCHVRSEAEMSLGKLMVTMRTSKPLNFRLYLFLFFILELSENPAITSDSKMKRSIRKTIYEAIDIQSESSLASDQEHFQVMSNTYHAKLLQPRRTILYDTSDNSDRDMASAVQPHNASVMDVTYESDPEAEKQRLSARRTIVFGENTVNTNIETADLSALQPLPNMSAFNTESSNCSMKSKINISTSEAILPPRETTYLNEESMEKSSETLVAEEEKRSVLAELTIDVCRAAPYQQDVEKSLHIAESTAVCDKTMTKKHTVTPSKIPIAKHRLTVVNGQRESQHTFVGDVPEALLENVSDPCVESLEEGQLQKEQQTSNRSSTQTHNFERFRERYLNLTMPRFSDANQANGTLATRQSFGSITNLMNFSTPSAECSAIMDEIKEKFRNFRPSDGTANASVMDKGKVVIDLSEYNAKIADIQIRRAPLDEMMANIKSKMEKLKHITNSGSTVKNPEDDPGDDQTKLVGAIFPLAPSFTSLWQNVGKW
jgi:hypothetical protein